MSGIFGSREGSRTTIPSENAQSSANGLFQGVSSAPSAADSERGGIAWRIAQDYVAGDLVTFQNNLYVCILADLNSQTNPASNATNWRVASATGGLGGIPLWNAGTTYSEGDFVRDIDDNLYVYRNTTAAAGIDPQQDANESH